MSHAEDRTTQIIDIEPQINVIEILQSIYAYETNDNGLS